MKYRVSWTAPFKGGISTDVEVDDVPKLVKLYVSWGASLVTIERQAS